MPWVIYSGHGHLLNAPNKTYRAVIRNGAGPLILLLCLTRSSRSADVESIIQEYLMENPEIIRSALIELDKKEDRAALAAVSDSLFKDPRDVSIGPKDAKVTVVEFFDYNCGFCKQSADWVESVMKKYPDDVRVIFKELPILDGRTKTSKNAAKAALAAARQGKYKAMHFALMNERGLSADRIFAIAEKEGLDVEKLKKDMEDPEMERQIADGLLLANRIPSFTRAVFRPPSKTFTGPEDKSLKVEP